MTSARTRVVAVLACLAAAMFPSACAESAPAGDAGTTQEQPVITGEAAGHNAADIAFATDMIPHHQQAVAMSALVPQRSTNAEVQKLASDISGAQGSEIETFKVLLVQWNENPDLDTGSGNGGQSGGMVGMVDEATMARLASLEGAEFDQLWLQSMIGHHKGAIEMAKTETADGANVDAKSIARNIVTTQQTQIDEMNQLLGG
jgi:uncharacterized protein (DUF305 family)